MVNLRTGYFLPPLSVLYADHDNFPRGFKKADGTNGTPDMSERILRGASDNAPVNSKGGSTSISGSHTHSIIQATAPATFDPDDTGSSTSSIAVNNCSYHEHMVSFGSTSLNVDQYPNYIALYHLFSCNIKSKTPYSLLCQSITDISGYAKITTYNDKFLLGVSTEKTLLNTGGSNTITAHSHTSSQYSQNCANTSIASVTGSEYTGSGTEYDIGDFPTPSHTHPISNIGSTSITLTPYYTTVSLIQKNSLINMRRKIESGVIIATTNPQIPPDWKKCDGTNDTPNLVERYSLPSSTPNSEGGNPYGSHSHTKPSLTAVSISRPVGYIYVGYLAGSGSVAVFYEGYNGSTITHTHSIPVNVPSANAFSTPYTPPYYSVHFIMKE